MGGATRRQRQCSCPKRPQRANWLASPFRATQGGLLSLRQPALVQILLPPGPQPISLGPFPSKRCIYHKTTREYTKRLEDSVSSLEPAGAVQWGRGKSSGSNCVMENVNQCCIHTGGFQDRNWLRCRVHTPVEMFYVHSPQIPKICISLRPVSV